MENKTYTVDVSLDTITQIRAIIIQLGLGKIFKGGDIAPKDAMESVIKFITVDPELCNQFCQIVTKTQDDFIHAPLNVTFGIIERFRADFFAAIPPFWWDQIKKVIKSLQEMGMIYLQKQASNGSTNPSPSAEAVNPEI